MKYLKRKSILLNHLFQTMVKHIGIVGCSAEGAALCYTTICQEGSKYLGKYGHPEVTMHTFPLNEYMEYIYQDDWEGVADLMIKSTEILQKAGADFVISPDNTIHEAFKYVKPKSPLPWLHIAEVVAIEAKKNNFQKLGVLGTDYLMNGPVYREVLADHEIEYMFPKEEEKQKVSQIIFEELVHGNFTDSSREYFSDVIDKMKDRGCDAVVLGCTEIPLIVTPQSSGLPTLDSTRLLAKAALKFAME